MAKNHFGKKCRFFETEKQGHATAISRQLACEGAGLIVCAGGDGTINEVVNGLFEDRRLINPHIELGIVDFGSGSGFAQSTGIPQNMDEQVDLIVNAAPTLTDIGLCTFSANGRPSKERYFISECQVGIGSAVVQRTGSKYKILGGKAAFGLAAMMEIIHSRVYELTLEFKNSTLSDQVIGIVIGNGHACGGGMRLTPMATIDDGKLDLLVIHEMDRITQLSEFLKIYSGNHIRSTHFSYHRITGLKITSENDLPVETDGELVGRLPVEIKVIPRVLKIRNRSMIKKQL